MVTLSPDCVRTKNDEIHTTSASFRAAHLVCVRFNLDIGQPARAFLGAHVAHVDSLLFFAVFRLFYARNTASKHIFASKERAVINRRGW